MNKTAMTVLVGLCVGGLAVLPVTAVEPGAAIAPPPPAIVDEKTADKASAASPSRPVGQADPIQGDPELEPQVTLVEREDETREEVRVNGILRYIKVTPKVGPVYYLVPVSGASGVFVQRDSLDSGLRVPMWQLFSW
ncbi:MAG: DUF2782 domain-containing protein [Burkholderiales bacterium]|jgi:hypothetical protein|nr:DUF2782 domain-containing protein [Burkholderiales bacterium]